MTTTPQRTFARQTSRRRFAPHDWHFTLTDRRFTAGSLRRLRYDVGLHLGAQQRRLVGAAQSEDEDRSPRPFDGDAVLAESRRQVQGEGGLGRGRGPLVGEQTDPVGRRRIPHWYAISITLVILSGTHFKKFVGIRIGVPVTISVSSLRRPKARYLPL